MLSDQNIFFDAMTEYRSGDYLPYRTRGSITFALLQGPNIQIVLPIGITLVEKHVTLLGFQLRNKK